MLKAFNTIFYFIRSILNLPKAPYILMVFLTFFLFLKSEDYYHFIDSDKYERRMLESDGSGYFAYLPQTFLYKTKNFEFINDFKVKYPESKIEQGLSNEINGKRTNKYFVGTAICIAPFYFTVHQLVLLYGGNADGYSVPYELSILLAGLAFLFLGMWSIVRLFRKFSLSNVTIIFSLIGLTLSTNIYYYTIFHPDFSHIYAFGLISFLLLQFKNYADKKDKKTLIIIGFILGLIAIIRPTDALVIILLPFFFSSFKSFTNQLQCIFRKQKGAFFLATLLFAIFVGLQFLNIYQQTGQWRFNEYGAGKEGFDFLLSPKVVEVLFSFRKGFFIYTPFFILLIPGFIELCRWNKYFFVGILFFFILFVYIMASWWCWYYGGSLGMRPLIDIYSVLIIPVALLFEKAKGYFKVVLFLFLFTMIDVNTTYSYQLQNGILHYSDMNKKRFLNNFLQTGKRYEWMVFMDEPTFDKLKFSKKESWIYDSSTKSWTLTKNVQPSDKEFLGNPSLLMFTPNSSMDSSKIALEINFEVLLKKEESVSKVLLFGYQNGERKELSVNYLKYQIPRLNRFHRVEAKLFSEEKYGQMDSLEIMVENDAHGGLIKSLQADFFVGK